MTKARSRRRLPKGQAHLASDAVVVGDERGLLVGWNRAAEVEFGYSSHDALGHPLAEVLAITRDDDSLLALDSAARPDGTTGLVKIRNRDGREIQATVSVIAREDARLLVVVTRSATSAAAGRRDDAWANALLHRGRDVAYVVDASGTIVFVPEVANPPLGYDAAALVGRAALELVHPEDQELARRLFDVTVADDAPRQLVGLRCLASDGSWRFVEVAVTNLLDNPVVTGLVVNIRDVTERRAIEDALRASEALYRSIVETAQEGIWLMDDSGRSLFANDSLSDILGHSLPEIMQMNVFEVIEPQYQREAHQRLRSRRIAGHEVYEIPFLRGDGDRRWASVSASPLTVKGHYIGSLLMISDTTKRKRTEAELEHRAMYDDLTGLPNRALLRDRLSQAMGRRDTVKSVGVFFIDLDDFKSVNDSYGHAAGDEVLRQVADRFRAIVRHDDDTLARFAGDEFVIVAPDLEGELEANALAERIVEALTPPLTVHGRAVQAHASIGVALSKSPADVEQMILDADVAMFQAKKRGRGRHVMFDPEIARQSRYHLEDVQELRTGIEQDQLEVFYQPQVDMTNGSIGSVEALARWRHPSRGLLEPSEFIDLAEVSGLILALGRRVLRVACQQAAEWADTLAEPPAVAVNVSASQLDDETFPETVREALAESGLAPGLLVLEITESALMSDTDRALRVLKALRAQGVHLAIDDFGTGYSSLIHLKRLPIEEIKIDREFVGVDQTGDDRSIVRAMVSMAKALALHVVAEGVETTGQAAALQELGCNVAQGYLYGRPVDAALMSATLGAA
ncbi:MAG: hypothetical protein JWO27_1294 [Frankiales bacterium]|nr:hypothetical protein [Frankiales bacterium]